MQFAVVGQKFWHNGKCFQKGDWCWIRASKDGLLVMDFLSGNESIKLPLSCCNFLVQGMSFRRRGSDNFDPRHLPYSRHVVVITKEVRFGLTVITGYLSVTFDIDMNTITVRNYSEDTVKSETLHVPQKVKIFFSSFSLYYDLRFIQPFTPELPETEEVPKVAEMTEEKPETALVAARVERKCLPSCSIQ